MTTYQPMQVVVPGVPREASQGEAWRVLLERNRLWHDAHNVAPSPPPRTSPPRRQRGWERREVAAREPEPVEIVDEDDLLALAILRHGGKNPFL